MEIIYGKEPQSYLEPTISRYQPLWDALTNGSVTGEAWAAVKSSDIGPGTAKAKLSRLTGSAQRLLGRRIQVRVEDELIFVRLRASEPPTKSAPLATHVADKSPANSAAANTEPETASPQPPQAIAGGAARVSPAVAASVAPQPSQVARMAVPEAKDPSAMGKAIELFVDQVATAKDPEQWLSFDLGGDSSWYETITREVRAGARDKRLAVEHDRDGRTLYCRRAAEVAR
jgi:hypothetical protein